MMECPQCHRTYAEDFSFCLDDGSRLVDPRALEKTAILQTPQQAAPTEITPAPSTAPVHAPATTRSLPAAPTSHRSWGKTILVLFGMIFIVLLWGMIKVGLWWLDHNQTSTNENLSSAPSIATVTPSPSPSFNPLSLLSPPSPSPINAPTNQTLPSLITSAIEPGTYQCELSKRIEEVTKQGAVFKIRITFHPDGTYFEQGYISLTEAGLKDQLAMEEKGNYSTSADMLILTNRLKRELILQDSSTASWSVPSDGSESKQKLRNATANSFQIYDDDEKGWFTFKRN
ncbi:MAG TPA: hypothetical protein VJ372_21690 [Pyrinomonadaceae bacterium]|jgi:hypothetical protein|nr:hypothetical protein [Pyrinomonadaceae bacterium]